MLIGTLGLGFLIGMQHALEPDHVAAVSSIASGERTVSSITRHGVFWGAGHTITLLVIGGACLALSSSAPADLTDGLEWLVGVMLVGLGGQVLYRVWRDKVHFHGHRHASGDVHLHVHSHRSDGQPHPTSKHDHEHIKTLPWRSLAVGLVHGVAGSGALIVLTASTLESPLWGAVYILTFGLGSLAGMAFLSAVIAVPLKLASASLTIANTTLRGFIGLATCAIGVNILVHSASLS